jgi:hypothetical protein
MLGGGKGCAQCSVLCALKDGCAQHMGQVKRNIIHIILHAQNLLILLKTF